MTQVVEAGVVAGLGAGVLGAAELEDSLEEEVEEEVESVELVEEPGVVEVVEVLDALKEDPRLSFL